MKPKLVYYPTARPDVLPVLGHEYSYRYLLISFIEPEGRKAVRTVASVRYYVILSE
jgi:hypothetical protein